VSRKDNYFKRSFLNLKASRVYTIFINTLVKIGYKSWFGHIFIDKPIR
jgi:hypothetical protein